MRFATCCLVTALLLAAACGSSDDGDPDTITVPTDEPTIQAAVDAASPGDLILIEPGTYDEGVIVETDDIAIRGLDRNEVVVDGNDELFDGFLVVADGVAIENLTVKRFVQNGIIFTGRSTYDTGDGGEANASVENGEGTLDGYRASHITAINNGTYGIYAFAATNGVIEQSYASGHPDSGFYIGQCKPCNVVLDAVTAERNSIGYFGTNASGGVFVVNSTFRNNRLGLTPNSQIAEQLAPQEGAVIAGNVVEDNDDPNAPAIANGFFAGGIAVGGGNDNLVLRNRVTGHDGFGIGVIPLDDFVPIDNRVEGNVVTGNGVDIVVDLAGSSPTGLGNCFSNNEFETESPTDIAAVLDCESEPMPVASNPYVPPAAPPNVDYRQLAEPQAQPSMPDVTAPALPAGAPPAIEIDEIELPA